MSDPWDRDLDALYSYFFLTVAVGVYYATRRRKSEAWVAPINRGQAVHGHHATLFNELRADDRLSRLTHLSTLRVNKAQFDQLLRLVEPLIARRDTTYRECVSPAERLSVTLHHLASGASVGTLALHYRRGR